ncbi:MAG: OmpA family protein [Candidatus Cloacimonetes bacterium]|nr:OmpA family protein [Candidatus Cloacimonadota bacterium]
MNKFLLLILTVFLVAGLYASNERFLRNGEKYFMQGDYEKAEELLLMSMQKTTVLPEHHYWLGKTYIALQKYDLAYEHISIYKEKNFGADIREVDAILNILSNQIELSKTGRNIYTLGTIYGAVNSEYSDFAPVVFDNGRKMYFTSQRFADLGKENIWMVELKGGIWANPVLIKDLSTNRNESLGALTEDGYVAYLFGNYLSNSKNGDIYMTRETDKGWEKPSLIAGINTDKIEVYPYVYEDLMFFASNRDGGFGELDLYVSQKVNGNWSKPQNLGPIINTPEHEQTPFLDWDGKTLYFASDGHPGLGGFDIFKSEKIGDSWQDWSEPENLGLVVNTVKDDRYYYASPYENVAYIASNRFTGMGHEDIYKLNIAPPEEIVEEELIIPEYEDPMIDMARDEIIVIDNVYFDFDQATLKTESFQSLDYAVSWLMQHPEYKIEISGHTDSIGPSEYNLNLSLRRAEAVVEYFVEKGLNADNMISKGYGEDNPVADNATDEGRAENRRVEIKILDIDEDFLELELEE